MKLTVTLDCDALPDEEAEHLKRLISAAALFEHPRSLKSASEGADRFQYQVMVEEGGRTKRIEMDESSVPKTCRPLLEYLTDSARTRPKKKSS